MAKTVAEQFVEILAAAGVKRIYGIVGDSLEIVRHLFSAPPAVR
jgi:pyruvate dehydrogenase (quinone)